MEIGNILLFSSFLTSVLSALIFYIALKERLDKAAIAENLLYASTSLSLASMLVLFYYFLTDNFSVWYVYANSNLEMPALYKISALWAGKEGSLLLWAFLTLLITSIYVSTGKKDVVKAKVATIMGVFSAYLLFLTFFTSNPFTVLPYTTHNGYGLNPLLRTTEMIFHPIVIFSAYSLSALLFAMVISGSDVILQRKVAKLTWIFFSIGIIIGGWWAYRTLGWGGFWGWDPVENASLLPWITLTIYFHLKKHQELFAYLTFVLVLFATFVTRSGVISSVHSFGGEYFDFAYLLPIFAAIVPVLINIKKFGDLRSVCTQHLQILFSSMLIVVFLGTVANLMVKVERSYYLITFLPLFAIIVGLVILKIKKMDSVIKLVHLGVIFLFVGSTSAWLFEQHYELNLGSGDGFSDGGFTLRDIWVREDLEKFIVVFEVQTPYGTVHPKFLIYKIERSDRRVPTVELISYPWADYYFALSGFDLDKKTVTLEYYVVPLILMVWVGSILMIAGGILRLRS